MIAARRVLAGFVVVSALSCVASYAEEGSARSNAVAAPPAQLGASEAQRKSFIAATIPFGKDEGDGFWPLYRDYRRDMSKLEDRRAKIAAEYVETFRTMTSGQAKSIADGYLQIDEAVVKLKREYLKKFLKFLPQTKATRVLMIDARFDSAALARLTAKMPVTGMSPTRKVPQH